MIFSCDDRPSVSNMMKNDENDEKWWILIDLYTLNQYLGPTESVNYEGELAVVISGEGRGITKEDAFNYVYGYTVINDVTARTLQHKQWFIGKSFDGFCPMGRSSWPLTKRAM